MIGCLRARVGCLQTCVRKQPIIALYFEFENELKFYNLEASLHDTNDIPETLWKISGRCIRLTFVSQNSTDNVSRLAK